MSFTRPFFGCVLGLAAGLVMSTSCAAPPASPTPPPAAVTSPADAAAPDAAKRPRRAADPQELASPTTEAQALKKVPVPNGIELTLFAAPPAVGYPTSVAASPDGDVYVAIDENGALGAKAGRGRIVKCVDKDGDGHADAFTTFATMDSPRGVIWDAGALYVVHPPFVTGYHDDNDDGVADREETLVSGLGFDLKFRGADHSTNGGRLGADGFIYVAVGDYGAVAARGKDGATLHMKGGGVVRVRTDGTGLQFVSRGQRNIYDVAVDPDLNLFTRDNTNDGDGWNVRFSHVVAGGQYGYPWLFKNFADEIIPALNDLGPGSPTGALYLDEPALGPAFPAGVYTLEWGRRAAFRHPLQIKGASFTASEQEVFKIPRPTDMDADARGHLFVTSWEGAVFNYAGPNAGYVVRLSPKGAALAPPLGLRAQTDVQLLACLQSPSGAARFGCQRELIRRGPRADAVSALQTLVRGQGPRAARVLALHALSQLQGAGAQPVLRGLALSMSGDLRAQALRALGDDPARAAGLPTSVLTAALTDKDARVRLQAVTTIAELGRADAAARVLARVQDEDPTVSHVAVKTLATLNARDVLLGTLDSGPAKTKDAALRALRTMHDESTVAGLVARLKRTRDAKLRRGLLSTLCRLHRRESAYEAGKWWGTRPDTSGPYYKPEEWAGSEAVAAVLRQTLTAANKDDARWLIGEFSHNRVVFEGSTELMLAKSEGDTAMRLTAVEGMFGEKSALPGPAFALLQTIARDEREVPELRARALSLVLRAYGNKDAFDGVLDTYAPLAGRDLAQPALAKAFDEFLRDPRHERWVSLLGDVARAPQTPLARRTLAQSVLLTFVGSPLGARRAKAQATQIIQSLWTKPELVAGLLGAVARTGSRSESDHVRAFMTSSDHAVAEAAKFASERLGLGGGGAAANNGNALIEGIPFEQVVTKVIASKGDAEQGKTLFTRQGCIACHIIDPHEAPRGPSLDGIATRYSRKELCESILKPSARIAQGFESQWFETRGGERIEGFVTREAGDDLEVRTVSGAATTLRKKDLTARGKQDISIMPEGLAANLTPDELASLIAFLESLSPR